MAIIGRWILQKNEAVQEGYRKWCSPTELGFLVSFTRFEKAEQFLREVLLRTQHRSDAIGEAAELSAAGFCKVLRNNMHSKWYYLDVDSAAEFPPVDDTRRPVARFLDLHDRR